MKKKLSLESLMVKSFVTSKSVNFETVKGGYLVKFSGSPCSEVDDGGDGGGGNHTNGFGCIKTQVGENTCGFSQLQCSSGCNP